MEAARHLRKRAGHGFANSGVAPVQRRRVAGSDDEDRPATGEAGKRRARHEIWELESQVVERHATIAQLELDNQLLQRRMHMLQASVRVREQQTSVLEAYGAPPPSAHAGPRPELFWLTRSTLRACVPPVSAPPSSADLLLPARVTSFDGNGVFSPPAMSSAALSWPSSSPSSQGGSHMDGYASNLGAQCIQGPQFASGVAPHAEVCSKQLATVKHNVGQLTRMNAGQAIHDYKQTCTQLSQLLFAAEDASSDGQGLLARVELEQFVESQLRTIGGIAKVCNPVILSTVSQPVNEGMDSAPASHWEAVATALLLTKQQVEDLRILDQLHSQWQTRITVEQAGVSSILEEVLKEAEQQWKVHWAEGLVRKQEMMSKLQRVMGSHRWLVVLVDGLLLGTLLTSVQVARFVVHSYPWVPDAVALVQAVARQPTAKPA